MTLYVLRHAIAEDPGPSQPDSARRLTEPGRVKARRVLSHAARVGVRPQVILTSPYVRASETAEIARDELGFAGRPVQNHSLVPYVGVFDLWEELHDYLASGDLMVVGHNPQLSSLVAWLIGARSDALWLKKSGLVALDVGIAGRLPRAMLSWLLTPRSVGK